MTDMEYRNAWAMAYHEGGEDAASAITLEWLTGMCAPMTHSESIAYWSLEAQKNIDELFKR